MTRRALLLATLPGPLFAADPAAEVWDLMASAATALGSGSAAEFMALFDPGTPSIERLRTDVAALVQQNDVLSAIEPLSNEGDATTRRVELDWELQLTSHAETPRVVRRHEVVKCRVAKQGRKWRIVEISPVSFFAPPQIPAG